jgi:outer membrane protein assembly factor BamB
VGSTLAVLVLVAVAWWGQQTEPAALASDRREGDGAPVLVPRDWPMWGGSVARNLVNRVEHNIPESWDATPGQEQNLLWIADLGSKAMGGPVVAGGKIYVCTNNQKPRDPNVKGDKGVVMCFEEKTGAFLWQIVFDKLPDGRVNDWPEEGIVSVPVVERDYLYFVSNRCEVVCASTIDGAIRWKLDMFGKLGAFPHNLATSSPLIVGDTLFVVTFNGVDLDHLNIPAPEAPSFLGIDKHRGTVRWSSNLPTAGLIAARKKKPNVTLSELVNQGLVLMHAQWSSPVYTEVGGKAQVIFPGGDGWLYSFNPDNGTLLWKFDCNPKSAVYVMGGRGTRNDFIATPVVADGKLYIGVGQDPEHTKGVGHLWCIDITREPKNPEKDLSPFSDPKDLNPKFDPKDPRNKDSALVWHYGGEAPPGSKRRYLFGRTLSTCCVVNGLCFAAEYDGYVHCLDAKTGEKYWEHRMDGDTWCSPYYVDGKVFIGNEQGEVLVFKASKEKPDPRTIEMPGQPCQIRTAPIAANGVLYMLTENPTRMYAIRKK